MQDLTVTIVQGELAREDPATNLSGVALKTADTRNLTYSGANRVLFVGQVFPRLNK